MNETVVRKVVTVNCSVEDAFRVFTEELGEWWPHRTHSVEEESVETVIFECRLGGRFYERAENGTEHTWGTIRVWAPPTRVVYSWHPGRGEETAQDVEVTFTPDGDSTRVELVHTGWEVLGDRMAEVVADYERGWDKVLGCYVEAATGAGTRTGS
jgi:uncharacterized protein YndB with AHSA1/START domain